MGEWTRDSVIEAAKRAAAQLAGPLSMSEFRRLSGVTDHQIYRLFPERGWSEIRELAGIPRHPFDRDSFSDADLLRRLHQVISDLQEIPTQYQFDARADISSSVLKKRFGGWRSALHRYREWLVEKEPNSPLLQHMASELSREPIAKPLPVVRRTEWAKEPGLIYGAPISFRGLRHAPINEQGVVYLFGMVSSELGLIVEAVQSAFPDCEAKRCIDSRQNRWQRVRIEFEFVSSNFAEHGHDPKGCDLIVCWEHDWPDCPLEVVELRAVIRELPSD